MAKKPFTEADIRKIASKYVWTVRRDPSTFPNITKLITEALRKTAPKRAVEQHHVESVLTHLQKRTTFSDKNILEAAKKVADQGAMDDLKYMINRNMQAMGRKSNDKDVQAIIKKSNLDPHNSSLAQIKAAVKDFYSSERSIENMSPAEIRDSVRKEISKVVPNPDEKTVKEVTDKYLNHADEEKPIDYQDLADIVKAHISGASQPPTTSRVAKGRGVIVKPKGKINPGNWVPPKNARKMTFFEKIRYKMRRYGLRPLSRNARNWLTDTVNKTKKTPNRSNLLKENQTLAEAFIGKMFMFFYDAKTKDDLPYWDKFPLIFVIELYKDGWLGLNMHYLPMPMRLKLFDKLLQFANDKSLDKMEKLQLSYSLLKSVSQFPEVQPTIKRYLASHVKSDLVTVEPIDWETAVFLPVEQFQKEKKERVWADSAAMVRSKRKTVAQKISETRKKQKAKWNEGTKRWE